MFDALPQSAQTILDWDWPRFAPYVDDLLNRPLDAASVARWLADWTALGELVDELGARLYVATTVNTEDTGAQQRFHAFLEHIAEPAEAAEQRLKEKLLASGLEPAGFAVALRNMRAEAALFREENLPLFTQEQKLNNEYDQIIGAQTVEWDGQERTLAQLRPVLQEADRDRRERAWRLSAARQLADRAALDALWQKLLPLRRQQAANAGYDSYRDFRWQQFNRFDYTPADCRAFHAAIEAAVVPAARRIYARRQQRLGLATLRPWDLNVDPQGRAPLRPFENVAELESRTEAIFRQVDPALGERFATMRREGLLDLDNRKGKAPGGYQITLERAKRPFIFMNAVGIHDDVQTMLHEGGHAFHCFESAALPYIQQRSISAEIAEVASMSMELLAAPYLTAESGGFYSPADAARARIEHLEGMILFWPYMAVVDAFQHWVYTHPDEALRPADCDAAWAGLWDRFMAGIDYSGLDAEKATGWQRKLHIFQIPFYYVDYGLAQLGAVQVWHSALSDQAGAVAAYRRALALGGTRPLPELYAAAGAKFAFDTATVSEAVALIEQTLDQLEAV